jgi:hypothetical protein
MTKGNGQFMQYRIMLSFYCFSFWWGIRTPRKEKKTSLRVQHKSNFNTKHLQLPSRSTSCRWQSKSQVFLPHFVDPWGSNKPSTPWIHPNGNEGACQQFRWGRQHPPKEHRGLNKIVNNRQNEDAKKQKTNQKNISFETK